MAEVTLSASNSKNVVGIAANQGYQNRVKALIYEHALNLIDSGAASVNETASGNGSGGAPRV